MQSPCFPSFGKQFLYSRFCDSSNQHQGWYQTMPVASPSTNSCHSLFSDLCHVSSSNLSMSSSEHSLPLYQTLSCMCHSHTVSLVIKALNTLNWADSSHQGGHLSLNKQYMLCLSEQTHNISRWYCLEYQAWILVNYWWHRTSDDISKMSFQKTFHPISLILHIKQDIAYNPSK